MLHKNEKISTEQVQMVSIEQLVPKDHILRKIDKYINFNFIYDLVKINTHKQRADQVSTQ